MSEHDDLTEAREALADTVEMACAGNALAARCWVEQYGLVILAALDGHAAALSAARREGAAEAFERAERECEVKVRRESGYGGRWEGYGAHMGDRTGPECAAAIHALAEKERGR